MKQKRDEDTSASPTVACGIPMGTGDGDVDRVSVMWQTKGIMTETRSSELEIKVRGRQNLKRRDEDVKM